MATPGLPLPEIGENGEEEFERSWTKFKTQVSSGGEQVGRRKGPANVTCAPPRQIGRDIRIATRRGKG